MMPAALAAELRAWMGPEGAALLEAFEEALTALVAAGQTGGGLTPRHARERWTRRVFEGRFGGGRVTEEATGAPVTDLRPVWDLIRAGEPIWSSETPGGERTEARSPDAALGNYLFVGGYALDYSDWADQARQYAVFDEMDDATARRAARVAGFLRRAFPGEDPPEELRPALEHYLGSAAGLTGEPWHSQLGRALVLKGRRGDRPAEGVALLVCAMLLATGASWAMAWVVFDAQRKVLDAKVSLEELGMDRACRPLHWVWLLATLATAAVVLSRAPRGAGSGSAWVEEVLRSGEQPAASSSAAEIARALQGERRWGLVWAWVLTHFLSHLLIDAGWTAYLRRRGQDVPAGLRSLTTVDFFRRVGEALRAERHSGSPPQQTKI